MMAGPGTWFPALAVVCMLFGVNAENRLSDGEVAAYRDLCQGLYFRPACPAPDVVDDLFTTTTNFCDTHNELVCDNDVPTQVNENGVIVTKQYDSVAQINIDFSDTPVVGTEDPRYIPSTIGQFTNLRRFSIDSGSSVVKVTGSLPASFSSLTNLVEVSIRGQRLEGTLPADFSVFTQLSFWDTGDNMMEGTVPASLIAHSTLTEIHIDGNHDMHGTLPHPAENSQLVFLDISEVGLEGTLPCEIGRMQKLEKLHMRSNFFVGYVPTEIGVLTNLQQLYMTANNFVGTIPTEIGNMRALKHLTIGKGVIEGTIPSQIGRLTNLELLGISQLPRLTGTVPTELGLLTDVRDMFLYENMLHGRIPSEIGNMHSLLWLDIRSNLLAGTLPTQLGNVFDEDTNAQHFDFSNNYFYGDLSSINFGKTVVFDCDDTFLLPEIVCRVNRNEYRCPADEDPTYISQKAEIFSTSASRTCTGSSEGVSGSVYFRPAANEACFTMYSLHAYSADQQLMHTVLAEIPKSARSPGAYPVLRISFETSAPVESLVVVSKREMNDAEVSGADAQRMVPFENALPSCSSTPAPSPSVSSSMAPFPSFEPHSTVNKITLRVRVQKSTYSSAIVDDGSTRVATAAAINLVCSTCNVAPHDVYHVSYLAEPNNPNVMVLTMVIQSSTLDMVRIEQRVRTAEQTGGDDVHNSLQAAMRQELASAFSVTEIGLQVELDESTLAAATPSPSPSLQIEAENDEGGMDLQTGLGIGTVVAGGFIFFSVAWYVRGTGKTGKPSSKSRAHVQTGSSQQEFADAGNFGNQGFQHPADHPRADMIL